MADTASAPIKPLSEANLSDKELRHLAAAWLSCPAGDSIDYDKFAVLAGYPSVTNARKRLGEVKKGVRTRVFGVGAAADSAASQAAPTLAAKKATKAPKASPKRKAGASGDGGGSPSKRGKVASGEPGNKPVEEAISCETAGIAETEEED